MAVAWLVLGTVAYVALGLLGRMTIAGRRGAEPGLAGRRCRDADVRAHSTALVVAGGGAGCGSRASPVNLLTGASASQAAVFAVSNISQASSPCSSCGRWRRTCSVPEARAPRAAAGLLGGAGLVRGRGHSSAPWSAASAGALLGDWTLGDGVVWWARNAAGSIAIFTTGILALATWRRIRRPGGRPSSRASLRARGTRDAPDRHGDAAALPGVLRVIPRSRWPSRCWSPRCGPGCGSPR